MTKEEEIYNFANSEDLDMDPHYVVFKHFLANYTIMSYATLSSVSINF